MTILAALVVLLWPLVLRRAAAAKVLARFRSDDDRSPRRRFTRPPSSSRARDLADALERLAAALGAGAPLSPAFDAAAEVSSGALRDELSGVARDLAGGPTGALTRWRDDRPDDANVALVVGALSLGHATGGDRARAARAAAATLRERAHLEAEVRVQATQAKLSAAVVALMPIAFVGLAAVTDHRTVGFLRSPVGVFVACIALGLDVLGAWWMLWLAKRVLRWA